MPPCFLRGKARAVDLWSQTTQHDFGADDIAGARTVFDDSVRLVGVAKTEDVGSSSSSLQSTSAVHYLTVYECDQPCVLTKIEVRLYIPQGAPSELLFLVYQADSNDVSVYMVAHANVVEVEGANGPDFYSSGEISVNLKKGNRYAIGVCVRKNASTSYYAGRSSDSNPSFGRSDGVFAFPTGDANQQVILAYSTSQFRLQNATLRGFSTHAVNSFYPMPHHPRHTSAALRLLPTHLSRIISPCSPGRRDSR